MNHFATRLRALREAARLTITDLAESAGISRQTIYNYENGTGEPTWAVVCKLADCLDVSTEAFRDNPDWLALREELHAGDGAPPG